MNTIPAEMLYAHVDARSIIDCADRDRVGTLWSLVVCSDTKLKLNIKLKLNYQSAGKFEYEPGTTGGTGATGATTNTLANTTALAARATTLVPCPSAESYQQVAVTKAYKSGRENELNVRLGDEITVEIPNLKTLQDRARCQIPARKIVLFLDQRPVKDAIPCPPTDPNKPSLNFQLKPNETSRDVWTYILGELNGNLATSM